MILVATIEHSGTMQLLKILGRDVCPLAERARAEQHYLTKPDVLFAHLDDYNIEAVLAFEGVVLTTRRPEVDIRASWTRRGKDHAELDRQLINYGRLIERRPYILELGACR